MTSLSLTVGAECPDQSLDLQPWNPGHDQEHRVYIGQGRSLLLTSSATVHSVHISEGGTPASPRSLLSSLSGGMQAALTGEGQSFEFMSEHLAV